MKYIEYDIDQSQLCCDSAREIMRRDKRFMYEPHVRRHTLFIEGSAGCIALRLRYCPWCGTQYDEPLEDRLVQEIMDACGKTFNPESFMLDEDIPAEFKCSDWWKRRGL